MHEIFVLQYRHFPRRNRKEKSGTKSSAPSSCRQCGHSLRPVTMLLCPVCKRSMTTDQKLPKSNPKRKRAKTIMRKMVNICHIVAVFEKKEIFLSPFSQKTVLWDRLRWKIVFLRVFKAFLAKKRPSTDFASVSSTSDEWRVRKFFYGLRVMK